MAADVDVVVAGAGGAGLAAALAAAMRGASVALVERHELFAQGNNTSMSTAMIPAAGSRWQREAGIPDSPETFLTDVQRKTKGTADKVISRALVEVAPRLVEWLNDDCGIKLSLATEFVYPGHSYPRCHTVSDRAGRTLLAGLLAAAERQPNLDLVVPARLSALRPIEQPAGADENADANADADGRPPRWEVDITTPDGATETLTTNAVVLATGGYGGSPELVRRYIPEIADATYFGGDGCLGDALTLTSSLEPDTGYLDAYQGHGSVASPQSIILTWATVMHGGILVNARGERFDDETIGYSEYAKRVIDQPGRRAWTVFDRRIHDACLSFKDYTDLLSTGAVRWADSVEELAALIAGSTGTAGEEGGEQPDLATLTQTLRNTLEAARASAAGEAPDQFGRKSWEAPLEPPYAAVRVEGGLFHTQGGLLVDEHARVLRGGRPIEGLYAAGGAAAGMSGHGAAGYMAGNGLLAALGLGYLAGTHAGTHLAQAAGAA